MSDKWTPEDVAKILTNPFSQGVRTADGAVLVPPIVSRDTWVTANAALIERKEMSLKKWMRTMLDSFEESSAQFLQAAGDDGSRDD